MKVISTEKAPAAIGPYSQAMVVKGVVFTSGQIPLNPETGEIQGTTIEEQAEQVMKNLGAVLEAAGSSYEKTIKTTCFLADMGDFAAFNEVYGKYFTGKPSRSCVAVKTLPKNVLCEVEVIAEAE
ncbi:RidA family protein [Blautia sp.]|uniref:RidA family protein n=1 Tax=Blautia sp. TaxID=1955243 RepID=UPI002E79CBF8|nr:RidA family protein [Blautia sp.]MEE0809913.1 RidA family protein [Blautia sp.]